MENNIIISPYIENLMDSHQYQGQTNDCGPFSISIILNALNISPVTGQSMSKQLSGLQWNGILPTLFRFPNGGTLPSSIARSLRNYHLSSKWSIFSTKKKIIFQINSNHIVLLLIGQIFPLWAHYVICVTYCHKKGFGFIDPGSINNNIVWMPEEKLMKFWKTFAYSKIVIRDINITY